MGIRVLVIAFMLIFSLPCRFSRAGEGEKWIEGAELGRLAQKFVVQRLRGKGGKYTVEVTQCPARFALPEGDVNVRVIPPSTIRSIGPLLIHVGVYRGENLSMKIPLMLKVRRFEPVVVTSRSLRRHHIIAAKDVALAVRERQKGDGALTDVEEALGKRTTRFIGEGKVVIEREIEPPPVIRRGDGVQVSLLTDGLTIVTKGQAKEDGSVGESIRVVLEGTRREVRGRVVAEGSVQIGLND